MNHILYLASSSLPYMRTHRYIANKLRHRNISGLFSAVDYIHPFTGGRDHTTVYRTDTKAMFTFNDFIKSPIGQLELQLYLRHLPENIDLIRAGDPFGLGLLAKRLAKKRRIPYVVFIAANFTMAYERAGVRLLPLPWFMLKLIAHYVLRTADGVVAGNLDNEIWALRNGARQGRTITLRNNISILPLFYEKPPHKTRSLSCLHLSKLTKGYVEFIKDCIIATAKANLPLTLVGDGPCRKELELFASNYAHVTFTGELPANRVRDAFLSHKINLSTFGGATLVEAALSECYNISYNIEWQPEFTIDGWNGALVEPNVDCLAEAIQKAADNPHLRRKCGKQARKDALEMFDQTNLRKKEKDFYVNILKEYA